jgi:glycolate oxidase FAD binding subunit
MKNGVINEIGEAIQSHDKLLPFGNKTKTAIGIPNGTLALDLSSLKGIIEYEPSEYTFTAYAGTRLDEIDQMLAENDQFLPFDPPLMKRGATLGGTIASNLSGPGRYHFGGVRDFVLGVQFLDGEGRKINSGGKVVKNAAGFDIPKLMVGSLGSLGTLIELSIKVFPRPQKYKTIIAHYPTLSEAIEKLIQLTASPIEIFSLELEPTDNSIDLRIRIGGSEDLFDIRIDRLRELVGEIEILDDDAESIYWEHLNEFQWLPDGTVLVKVPITPKFVPIVEAFLNQFGLIRRYSVGANVAWIAWSGPLDKLDKHLQESNLSGLIILGSSGKIRLGAWKPGIFYQRIKKALDPLDKWIEV